MLMVPQERAVLGCTSNLASCSGASFRTLTFIGHLLDTALSAVNVLTQNSKQSSGSHTHFCLRLLTSAVLCALHTVPRAFPLTRLTVSLAGPPCSSLASSHMLLLCHRYFLYGKLFCLKSSRFIHLSSSKAQKHRSQEESPVCGHNHLPDTENSISMNVCLVQEEIYWWASLFTVYGLGKPRWMEVKEFHLTSCLNDICLKIYQKSGKL